MIHIFFAIIGLCCGTIVAGGLFGLITKLKLITRFADVTHTTSYLKHYENAIAVGATLGNILFLFPISLNIPLARLLLISFALFAGMFIGCLATALAEVLNVTAVFSRRMRLHSHLGLIMISTSLGRFVGSIFYFLM